MEPRYNELLYNEDLGIRNDFLYPSNSKIYEKEQNLDIANKFCQSLAPSIRYIELPLYTDEQTHGNIKSIC